MRYILPEGTFASLSLLKKEYQEKRHVDLSKDPSFFGWPRFLGGIDVAARKKQFSFIEKMQATLSENLIEMHEPNPSEQLSQEAELKNQVQSSTILTANRVMIVSCLYVQSQIGGLKKSNSELYNLINQLLAITKENTLDEEDKNNCFMAANRIINYSGTARDEANERLKELSMDAFTEKEWQQFSNFVAEYIKVHITDKDKPDPYRDYPVTSITKPFFGFTFGCAGAALGFVLGEVLSGTTQVLPQKVKFTATISSALLMLGSPSPLGIALFSQVMATKIITNYCSFSCSRLLELCLGIIGQGVGIGVGMPIDWSIHLIRKSLKIICDHYGPDLPTLSGIRISDGVKVEKGIPVALLQAMNQNLEEISPLLLSNETENIVTLKNDGLYLNDTLMSAVNESEEALPEDIYEKLTEELPKEWQKLNSSIEERAPEQSEDEMPMHSL